MILITSMISSIIVFQWSKTGILYAFALSVFMEVIYLFLMSNLLQTKENKIRDIKKLMAEQDQEKREKDDKINEYEQKVKDQQSLLSKKEEMIRNQKKKIGEHDIHVERFQRNIKELTDENGKFKRDIKAYRTRLGLDK